MSAERRSVGPNMVTGVIGSCQAFLRFFSWRRLATTASIEVGRSRPQRGGEKIVAALPPRKGLLSFSQNNFSATTDLWVFLF